MVRRLFTLRQTITYANAGHPPALLLTRQGDKALLAMTPPGAPVLGIMPQMEIPETTLPFPPTSELYLFTNGLYELLDPNGGRGSYDEFLTYLRKTNDAGSDIWEALRRWHEDSHAKKLIDDDVSMLRFATKA